MNRANAAPRKPTIGGQAVLEGVMMRSPRLSAVAVRAADGQIKVETAPVVDRAKRHPWMKWPVVRGVVAFVNALIDGVATMTRAADMLGDMEQEEPSRFEAWLTKKLGEKADKILTDAAMALGLLLAVGLFVALPSLSATLLKMVIPSRFLVNLLEGVVRLGLFVGYILAISKMKEIGRVFQYHGAEHKTVYCYENDLEMTVENCRPFPTLHPRCGTAFLFIVMVISLFLFTVFGFGSTFALRFLSRLLLMPVVAGVSFEALQWLGRHETPLAKALRWPGMQMQRLTTREPDDQMLEVSIAALLAADGKPWQKAQVPEQPAAASGNAASAADAPTECSSIAFGPEDAGEGAAQCAALKKNAAEAPTEDSEEAATEAPTEGSLGAAQEAASLKKDAAEAPAESSAEPSAEAAGV